VGTHVAGVPVAHLSSGTGPPIGLADRVSRAGGPVGLHPAASGGEEAGVAIRFGGKPIAALMARWRRAPGEAEHWLGGAAAIVAARADGWVHALRAASAGDSPVPGLLGGSPPMRAVRETVV